MSAPREDLCGDEETCAGGDIKAVWYLIVVCVRLKGSADTRGGML